MTRHFLTLRDLSRDELLQVIARASELKRLRGQPTHPKPLAGKSIGILLEKSSTRTRISFEVGTYELGGLPITLKPGDIQLGRGETLEDSGRMFSRFLHAVVFRTSTHERLRQLAAHSTVPVINGLCDLHHPTQLLADLQTVQESLGHLEGLRVAWVGDGNNMSHSWIEAASILGFDLLLACPVGYEPNAEILRLARQSPRSDIRVLTGPRAVEEAVRDADVVTTDVWVSMGQEGETGARNEVFLDFTVTDARMKLAKPSAIFLHCLPAHRGEEVSADVIDGAQSRVWDEAENRLHAQKALLELLLAPR
ncbi:MAG: Ornithine carbamoyltransferase [Myxococcaceae bacterium]|nr:Ornithine carbamoyltransferase [Myxococcaceae bacterium]